MEAMDRYEFTNKIIGEGNLAITKDLFDDNEGFNKAITEKGENFENKIINQLSRMDIPELNYLSGKYNLNVLIYGLK